MLLTDSPVSARAALPPGTTPGGRRQGRLLSTILALTCGCMNIDRDEARRIAALAHLRMSDRELDRCAVELTKILTYIDQLRAAEVHDGVAEEAEATPLRDDATRPSIDRDLVAANAPSWSDGFFVVPKVIGE